ncbi:hypothetical protein sscle_04g037150 [Sclerotinia sclerotiorum 1980 UF-70]|uniref:Uncharacterized protein n=1 Tax=Sclerotinia sclerotiorum (strain ATCC 18683 / 1980 / Ss-1) TaxID=665079 RepID=A0A1D9Q1X8_SCLS1|nr:hypothetical protein sscle_04g037150 [Sclerotinia sclerotiorum 1980 UF-70]
MCFRRRYLHVCRHESIRNGMCPEAENKGKFGDFELGCCGQSDMGLPVEEASFCPEYQLEIVIGQSEGNLLENRGAIGDAAYIVAFYKERDQWRKGVEALEENYSEDAERLKEGRDRLKDEFGENVEDINKDNTMFTKDMSALLARAGYDQAIHCQIRGTIERMLWIINGEGSFDVQVLGFLLMELTYRGVRILIAGGWDSGKE